MTQFSRRGLMAGAGGLALTPLSAAARGSAKPAIRLILAPNNLGLRPNQDGSQPGTWRAPETLIAAGLKARLHAREVVTLRRPHYVADAQPGTLIRNGPALRILSLELARDVADAIEAGRFPIVIGGDCSLLLGGLYGARIAGGRGLVHI